MISNRSFGILALAGAFVVLTTLPLAAQDQAAAAPAGRFTRLVKLVDKDGDGAISLAEAQEFAAARFDRLDTEHKGYLTLDAFEAPLRRAIERASDTRRSALQKALPRVEADFQAVNKAGDGHLTKDEFLADSRARFAAADSDKDGKLTLDELRRMRGHAF
jgi:Ca2+-binding EF-hand superfamily protein